MNDGKVVGTTQSTSSISKKLLRALPVNKNVLLLSFPKSGRTWLRYLFAAIYGEHLAASHDADFAKRYQLEILLFRDIRDLLVSYFFEVKYRPAGFGEIGQRWPMLEKRWAENDQNISNFVRLGVVDIVLEFYDCCLQRPQRRILMTYAELLADTEGVMRKTCDSLSTLADSMDVSNQVIEDAVEACRFENMRSVESAGQGIDGILKEGTWLPDLTPGNQGDSRSYKTRKGKVGGFIEYLSPDDIDFIDVKVRNHHAFQNVGNLLGIL